METTTEVVEPPTKYEYARCYGQMDYEQSMFQVLPTEEIMSHEYDTWPAGTRVPIPQTEYQFNDIMEPTSELVEPPTQFEYAGAMGRWTMSSPYSRT
jgi:hypothetical protein